MRWNGEKFEEALNDDLDNLLSVTDRRELREQIEADRDYQNEASWYYLIQDLFQDISKQDEQKIVPVGFTESVMQKISAAPAYNQNSQFSSFYRVLSYSLGFAA